MASVNGNGDRGRVDLVALGLAALGLGLIVATVVLSLLNHPVPSSFDNSVCTIIGAFAGAYTFSRQRGRKWNGGGVAENSVPLAPGVRQESRP